MPAKTPTINLLQREDLEHTPIGRITTWAVTYGRYIMIGTEIVVLLAFISRFSLDRKLTDLKEEIGQKQLILQANLPFERDLKLLQDKLAAVKTLLNNQNQPIDRVTLFQSLIPQGVYLESYDASQDKVTIAAVAGSTESFTQFLVNLQATPEITNVDVGDIKKQPLVGIRFKLTTEFKPTARTRQPEQQEQSEEE